MDGTQNFTANTLDKMEQHPSVQAMRIGRTKPYECSYPDCDDCGEWLEWLQSEAEMEE